MKEDHDIIQGITIAPTARIRKRALRQTAALPYERRARRHAKARAIARAVRQICSCAGAARPSLWDQVAFANFSTARLTRAVSGASACSVSLKEASVSLPDSAMVFSIVERA